MKRKIEISHTIPILDMYEDSDGIVIDTITSDSECGLCVYKTPERVAEDCYSIKGKCTCVHITGNCWTYAYPQTVVEMCTYIKSLGFKRVTLQPSGTMPDDVRNILLQGIDKIEVI